MWEDGNAESVRALINAADSARDKGTKRNYLQQALSSAKLIKDSYQRSNLIALINDKLRDL